MEQQQFKVSFSVGTKILVSFVFMLFTAIVFLNVSAILILKEDKRAYTYQSQSTAAVLAGREFVNIARHTLDSLRLILANVDPSKPINPQQSAAIQSVMNNQSDLVVAWVGLLNMQTGAFQPLTNVSDEKAVTALQLTPKDLEVDPESIKTALPELSQNPLAYINLSRLASAPLIGIVFADVNQRSNPAGMPIAIGIHSLQDLAHELKGLNLTIATKSGLLLFDTDPTALFSKTSLTQNPLFQAANASRVSSGAEEYDFNGNHYIGSYVSPGLNLTILANSEWKKAMKATYSLTEKFILLGMMGIGAAIIFAIFFAKSLTAPIGRLYQATKEVAKGNFNLQLESQGKDEISALTGSFNVMSEKISELIKESMEKVQLENELAIAATVQQTLFPEPSFSNQHIRIFSHYQSASQCGGDWWGFFEGGNKLCVMIADATGHGFPSALITASARSCFSVMQKLATEDPDFSFSPSAMLSFAHRVIYDASHGKVMMTFFCGVIDFDSKTLTYSSAGHNPPWLFKKSGDKYQLKSMTAVGQRLGDGVGNPEFEEKIVPLDPQDILFLYTDGLMEGKNKAGEQYGKKRTRKIIDGTIASGPEKLINSLMADFTKHNEGKPLDDDITLAAALILGGA